MGSKNLLGRGERGDRRMFVVDGIELVFFHQADQMRKLHRNNASRF